MIDGSHLDAAGGYAEGGILECLQFMDHDDKTLGNRKGAAWIKRDRIRDL